MPPTKRRRGRPSAKEVEKTVLGNGQMISMALPGGSRNFEMLSADELLTRKGYKVYREMKSDDMVKASLWFKKAMIASRPFDLKPAGETAEDKTASEFIQENLEKINIKRVVWDILSALDFGFSTGEVLWEITGSPPRLHCKGVKSRDPEFMFINVDKHGNIINFQQKPGVFSINVQDNITVGSDKILHYAYQKEFENHNGVSDLRAAYRAWWSKKYVTQFWNVFLERFGSPLMKMNYPNGASPELQDKLKSIMQNLSSKTDILVPEGVVIDLIEATRSGTAAYEAALQYYDSRIATAILTPALLGFGVDVKKGSDSQSRLHLRTLMKVIQFVGEELAGEIQVKIINPLTEANFNVDPPKFIFQDYGEFEAFEISDAIKELHNAGILELDGEDTNFIRSILGMLLRSEGDEDEVMRTEPPPVGGGPVDPNNPGATAGNKRAQKSPSTRKTVQRRK